MWKKIDRYYQTLKYLKKSQIRYLVRSRLTGRKKAATSAQAPAYGDLPLWIPRLDQHPDYRKRFSVEELLEGKVTLLHESGHPGEQDGGSRRNPICGILICIIWNS